MNLSEKSFIDVAIVGISCSFPGAENKEQFWELIKHHQTATEIPLATAKKGNVPAEGVLSNAYMFDASYFHLSPRDAKLMDPQLRQLLQHSVMALYDANVTEHLSDNKIGTFLSVGANQYLTKNLVNSPYYEDENLQYSLLIGNSHHCVATQVAYHLNLQGPAYTLSTACSSSLVAIYQACRSLSIGESGIALAGGASINIPQGQGYEFVTGSVLSQYGQCRPFSSESDGTVPASGVGILVLKRLADALTDGDPIYAVIKGGAVNNDGARKVGYTAPSIEGQREVIQQALRQSNVSAKDVEYIECHATGTALGDPIEIAALDLVYNQPEFGAGYALGGVKWNIGHTDSASGVAGVIKVAMSLKYNTIVGSPYLREYNPRLDIESTSLYVPRENIVYQNSCPKAAISAFGMGGTNCHLILEAHPEPEKQPVEKQNEGHSYLIPLSSRNASSLASLECDLLAWLEKNDSCSVADIAGTMIFCRPQENVRRFHLVKTIKELKASLSAPRTPIQTVASGAEALLIIEGQGGNIKGAAGQYYEYFPAFRHYFERCIRQFLSQPGIPKDLACVALDKNYQKNITTQHTLYAQPILFAIQYSLAKMLEDEGVHFSSYIGHSLGEWIAAAIAGLWDFEDAIRLIACRAVAIQRCDNGAMLAVFDTEKNVRSRLFNSLTVAAINGSHLVAISGSDADIDTLEQQLKNEERRTKRLLTNKAFHSPLLAKAIEPLKRIFATITFQQVHARIYSNLSGKKVSLTALCNKEYWLEQLLQPVQMLNCVEAIRVEKTVCVDLGLSGAMEQIVLGCHPSSRERFVAVRSVPVQEGEVALLGLLWTHGIAIDWQRRLSERWRKCNLPGYVFNQKEYFHQSTPATLRHKGKLPVAQWLYRDCWAIEPTSLKSCTTAEPLNEYRHWFRREHELFYIGFQDVDAITPEHLNIFLAEFKAISHECEMTAYVVISDSPQPLALQQQDCYRRALSSLCQVIPQENPGLSMKLLSYTGTLEHVLNADLSTVMNRANVLHIDTDRLWYKQYVPVDPSLKDPFVWPEQGYVLITGGLGKVGLILAAHIIAHSELNVVLTGRKYADAPIRPLYQLSESAITSIENDVAFEAIHHSERVFYASLCVTQQQDFQDLVERLNCRFGPIVGIAHCAGYTNPEGLMPLFSATESNIERHYQAKVDGMTSLTKICAKYEPEFCVLMSSISTVLGGIGLGIYAYVNQFMNEFVFTRCGAKTRWLSVSWDGWNLHDDPNLSNEVKQLAINNQDADEIFSSMFDLLSLRHFIVSTHNLHQRLAQWVSGPIPNGHTRHSLDRTQIAQIVREVFCRVLEVEEIDDHSNFFSLGGESVMFTSLMAEIKNSLGVALPLHEFMNIPTPEHIIDVITNTLGKTVVDRDRVSTVVKKIFVDLLHIDAVDEDSHFFDCGGDSLIFTQLSQCLRRKLGFELALHRFIDRPTVGRIVDLICPMDESDSGGEYNDLLLPDDLFPVKPLMNDARSDLNKVFLVTGAAGLLGSNLVLELLRNESVTRVVALVRAHDGQTAYQRVKTQLSRFAPEQELSKLSVISGDVSQPRLGLSDEDYQSVCENVTDILHNAARVNHILDYSSLKSTNTFSILEILAVASVFRPKNIHFVSTLAGVFELDERARYVEQLPSLSSRPQPQSNGYARSKWAAEVLLRQARERGFSINVVRPSSIVGHSTLGTFNAEHDHLWLFIKGCLQLGSFPDINNEINITPVDFMARLIIAICLSNKNKVYNVPNPNIGQMNDVFNILNRRGYVIHGADHKTWLIRDLAKVGKENALYPILSYYTYQNDDKPVISHDYRNVNVINTEEIMTGQGMKFPKPEEFIYKLVEFLDNDQFFTI
ncbi:MULTISPECIES: type I polyketide synthase [unclassified Brenneria]|uniref:type I polyketide synthase n=1 Tax=unclassified Brenneria TaxID=2634434 RepID=UPI0018F05F44|nr:type I polyketide synthase [Brenneria sp. L3-3C-1]MBJ7224073.1 thioester reductase domain-containing protein [Brenneria sp. L3-3C-1]MEE3645319.1 type I polyketide synthase [Brenneria sp. L3_3C_1]